MRKKASRVATILWAVFFSTTAPITSFSVADTGKALAQAPEEGGRARMNVAGRLPVLSQTMAAAACMLNAGFDLDHERALLKKSHNDFVRMLDALQNGNPRIGVPTPENKRSTLVEIDELRALWQPMDEAIIALLSENAGPEQAAVIARENRVVLEKSERLFSTVMDQYTTPFEMVMADAMSISFAERQEVFAEKLRREACEIGSGIASPEILADYDKTMRLFEASLKALHDGHPTVGIRPPPTPIIAKHLEEVMDDWLAAKPLLQAVRDNGSADEAEMVEIRKVTEALDYKMHAIVVEYLLAAPGANDMIDAPLRDYAMRELMGWLNDPVILDAIRAHNDETRDMTHEVLHAQNAQWVDELAAGAGPLMDDVLNNPASDRLKDMKAATSDIVTEVFIMDMRGTNVAESEPTTAYWHLNEERFQAVSNGQTDAIYVSDVHLEPGGEVYQAEVSLPITDPETGQQIGVASFGVNVQSMF